MLKTLLLSITIVTAPAWATVYYVDRTNGSDSAPGTSPGEAWQTLAHVAAQKLQPGDYVMLNRGETWTEPLQIQSSGSSLAPITFGVYGNATAAAPIINGAGVSLNGLTGLVNASGQHDFVINGITVENSPATGINIYAGADVSLLSLTVTGSRNFGILVYDSTSVVIGDSQVFNNALDTSTAWDGIRIDGDTGQYSGFVVRNNSIHNQIGGAGWNSANGIFLGHTTSNFTNLQNVLIVGNDVYSNGNPSQNQAGRGITGTFNGDVTVSGNYIHENASAGLYIGNEGMQIKILLENNTFYNNSLRQYGGYTTTTALAIRNTALVDNPNITAMGVEIGGTGAWTLQSNIFCYLTTTTNTWRGYIRLNDAATQPGLVSNGNMFFSPTPLAWVLPSGARVNFAQWQSLGFDLNSQNPQ